MRDPFAAALIVHSGSKLRGEFLRLIDHFIEFGEKCRELFGGEVRHGADCNDSRCVELFSFDLVCRKSEYGQTFS